MKPRIWTDERLARLRHLFVAESRTTPECAAILSIEMGRRFENTTIRSVLYLHSIRRSVPVVRRRKWSAEREAVLTRDWQGEQATADISAEINALPGPQISRYGIHAHAARMRLRRPMSVRYVPPAPLGRWYPERIEVLRRCRAAGCSNLDTASAVSLLPGPIVSERAAMFKAVALGFELVRAPKPVVVPVAAVAPPPPVIVPRIVPIAPPAQVIEPPPQPDGIIAASFAQVRAWCRRHGFDCDGSDMDRVNRARRYAGRQPFIIDWTAA